MDGRTDAHKSIKHDFFNGGARMNRRVTSGFFGFWGFLPGFLRWVVLTRTTKKRHKRFHKQRISLRDYHQAASLLGKFRSKRRRIK